MKLRRERIDGSDGVDAFDPGQLDPLGAPRIVVVETVDTGWDDLDELLGAEVEMIHCAPDEAATCFRPGVDVLVVGDGVDPIEQALVLQQMLELSAASPMPAVATNDTEPTLAAVSQPAPAVAPQPEDEPGTIRLGPLALFPGRQTVQSFDRTSRLRPREVELLTFFMQHPGETFSRQDLMEAVWGYTIGDPSTVTVHIRRLREKIEPDATKPTLLVTMWGAGYSLDVTGALAAAPPPELPSPTAPAPVLRAVEDPPADSSGAAARDEPRRAPEPPPAAPATIDDEADDDLDEVRPAAPPPAPPPAAPSARPVRPVTPSIGSTSRSAHSAPPVRPSSRRHRAERPAPAGNHDDPGGWTAATELAVTRVLDDLAALSRDRAEGGVSPRLWLLFEAVASLRLEGEVIDFEDAVMAFVGGVTGGDDRVTRYIDGLQTANEPFAERDQPVVTVGADHLEPLLDLGVLIAQDPTLFSHRAPLSAFALALARFDVDPGRVGPAPRTVRGALATWPARTGRLDSVIALSYSVGSKPLWVAGASLAEERVPALLIAMSDAARKMRAAERRVRQLRRSYLDEVADNSSLHLVQMIEMITSDPVVTVERITEQLGVSHQTIRNNLRRLETAGWLVEIGSFGRGGRKHWYAPAVFDAITYALTQSN